MNDEKHGLFVTIQEEVWPPPSILGWWVNCLLGTKSETKRVCTIENYTMKTVKVRVRDQVRLTVPAMDYGRFCLDPDGPTLSHNSWS